MKKRIEREEFNIALSKVLISYYDNDGDVNIIELCSTYSLGDMVVMGLPKNSSAAKRIGEGTDFILNLMEDDYYKNFDQCSGDDQSSTYDVIKSEDLETYKSDNILAPIIKDSVLSIECTPYQVISNEQFEHFVNIIAKIKGYLE